MNKITVDSFNKAYYNHNRYKGRSVYSPSGSLTGSVSVKKTKGSGKMADSVEYQIFIGCKDSQFQEEVVAEQELIRVITDYFERKRIDFSLMTMRGGYHYEVGWFDTEDTLCISIIGDSETDILRIAGSISMFMNQECTMVVKKPLKKDIR